MQGAAAPGREGRLDLSVPQVAGSAIAAIAAAKLASNLGVYGTIAGAGVVSVLGTCGGSILQHVLRRTGRHVQEVAVQARPAVRRVRGQSWGQDPSRTGAPRTGEVEEAGLTRPLDGTDPGADPSTRVDPVAGVDPVTGTPLAETAPVDGTSPTGTGPVTGTPPTGTAPISGTSPTTRVDPLSGADHPVDAASEADPAADSAPLTAAHPAGGSASPTGDTAGGGSGGPDGYGTATSYRVERRGWKRPVVGLVLAFGLTMGGISGYEAIAGENISGHGHGTTIGNAVTGHNAPHSGGSGHTPAPAPGETGTDTPSGGGGTATTSPPGRDGHGQPTPHVTPSDPRPSTSPSGGPSGGASPTPTPTAPSPTTTPTTPSPNVTPSGGNGTGSGDGTGDGVR